MICEHRHPLSSHHLIALSALLRDANLEEELLAQCLQTFKIGASDRPFTTTQTAPKP